MDNKVFYFFIFLLKILVWTENLLSLCSGRGTLYLYELDGEASSEYLLPGNFRPEKICSAFRFPLCTQFTIWLHGFGPDLVFRVFFQTISSTEAFISGT